MANSHGGKRVGAGRKRKPQGTTKPRGIKPDHGGRRAGAGRKGKYPKVDADRGSHVYIIHEVDAADICKIGITNNVAHRLSDLQISNWRQLVLAATVPVIAQSEALKIERYVHQIFAGKRLNGEWFRVTVQEALTAIGTAMVEIAIERRTPKQRELF